MSETTVFGWKSPWSGDEADPRPRTYALWIALYQGTRKLKHFVGWHDWRQLPAGNLYCDWCGANLSEHIESLKEVCADPPLIAPPKTIPPGNREPTATGSSPVNATQGESDRLPSKEAP